uniref:ER membrane protein complex subunit 10 n=1 Tax=Glossina palpalis gambiensis TaxID=67801 RepID=A0A1B0AR95_9MUSC
MRKTVKELTMHMLMLAALTFLSLAKLGMAYLEYDGSIHIELYHAVNPEIPDSFTYRGNITVSNVNSGISSINQRSLFTDEKTASKKFVYKNAFYRLRATVVYMSGARRTFLTANKFCSLINNQLNDEFWISIDGSGYVNAITYMVPQMNGVDDCPDFELESLILQDFTTDVLIKHTDLAPIPDTAGYIQKLEREREARQRGETKDTRGFFAKYWMYIVPIVLLMFISGASNPEQNK